MGFIIRNYENKDAQDIAAFHFLFHLAYLYNADYRPENMFCAELDGKVVASGHLEPTDSCEYLDREGQAPAYVHRFLFDIASAGHEEAEAALFARIVDRAHQIKRAYPAKRLQIGHACARDDLQQIDFLLSQGFYHELSYFIMRRDLTKPLPEPAVPDGIAIRRWAMDTEQEQALYLQAEKAGGSGESWSQARLNWFRGGPEWDTFTAFAGGEPVGSCMTWGLGEERSATEQIFTHPAWRRKGVAQAVIVEALQFLRDHRHKKEATLGVVAGNAPALALYKALGYELIDIHVLMVKELG